MEVQSKEFHSLTGLSKVEQYKWKLRDAPGAPRNVHKAALQVDHTYQRDLNGFKVSELARDWSWLACGVIIVAQRAEGGLFIVDGQHRWQAAMKRSDITHLPCLVFATEELTDEALGFLAANTNRKPLTSIAKFRALRQTQDDAAVLVDRLVSEVGRKVSQNTSGSTVRCVTQLLKWARNDPGTLVRMWPLIVELVEDGPILERTVDALMYLQRAMPEGHSLDDKTWKPRLKRLGMSGMNDAMNKAASYYQTGGAKVWARGLAQALNKGLRSNFLMRDDVKEDA